MYLLADSPHVFSNVLAVKKLSRNSASALGLYFKPSSEQSFNVQKLGIIINFAP
jgi:hypothetical protein